MLYFDCYTSIGKRGPKDQFAKWSTESLLEEMHHCGIDYSLCFHSLSRDYDPMYGNQILLSEKEKSKKLIGLFSAIPSECGDFPKLKEFINNLILNDIKGVILFPKTHRYGFEEMYCSDLIRNIVDHDVPIFVQVGLYEEYSQATFSEIDKFCTAFPKLKLVLLSIRWEQQRQIIPLMNKHKNIHIEFSSMQANRGIEYFTKIFSSDRLLFGSEFPIKSIGAAKAFIDYSDISDGDKENIAGKNLLKLLKTELHKNEPIILDGDDEIIKNAKQGKRIERIQIIDSHTHLNHKNAEGVGTSVQRKSDINGMIDRCDRIGISKICASSWLAIWSDYELGNDITAEAMTQYKDRVVGYASLDPNYISDMKSEIEKYHIQLKFKGLKPYRPRTLIPYNSNKYFEWFEFANRYNLFALMHPMENFSKEILDVSEKFPNVTFILAHSGISYEVAREHIEIAKQRKNVMLEITFTSVTNNMIEFLVNEIGSDRVLFGTDQPMRDPAPQFGWVAYANISYEDKVKIFYSNMNKIINNCKI